MIYYKVTENDKLTMIGTQTRVPSFGIEITKEEYEKLKEEISVKAKIDREAVENYAERVKMGEITLEDVPQEYRAQVDAIVNTPQPNNPYGVDNALYSQIEQGVIDKITEEARNNEQAPITE